LAEPPTAAGRLLAVFPGKRRVSQIGTSRARPRPAPPDPSRSQRATPPYEPERSRVGLSTGALRPPGPRPVPAGRAALHVCGSSDELADMHASAREIVIDDEAVWAAVEQASAAAAGTSRSEQLADPSRPSDVTRSKRSLAQRDPVPPSSPRAKVVELGLKRQNCRLLARALRERRGRHAVNTLRVRVRRVRTHVTPTCRKKRRKYSAEILFAQASRSHSQMPCDYMWSKLRRISSECT
jgi:hypothetical protein